ncbi:MAG TPA: hypothetical protein VG455_13025 [Acidimicrobiales bacterium]|nr:hypothetical protein [Acidimicrobiales bacterium]
MTEGPGQKRSPARSPDGRTIAFEIDDGRTGQIYVVGAEGGTPRVLGPGGTRNETPSWSHDGGRIAFSSDRSGKAESEATKELRRNPGGELLPPNVAAQDLYVMNADGTGVVQVTSDPSSNYAPVWSPDNMHLAFVSDRDGQNHIYLTGLQGGRERRLTTGFRFTEAPSWTR